MSELPGFEVPARDRELSQFFTPPWLAARTWAWMMPAAPRLPMRVLEPSAGDGALIRPLLARLAPETHVVAYEIDMRHVVELERLRASAGLPSEIRGVDFLGADLGGERFEISVLNPPYEDGQEIAFTEKVLGCSDRVGGIFRAAMLFGQKRNAFWRWTDVRRMALLSDRPDFGGDHSAKADFVVLDLQRRRAARRQGEASTSNVEWWLRSEGA